ncbi:right-handed parallel beta-helix repeat-containing protein [Leucobacter sp. HY1908]
MTKRVLAVFAAWCLAATGVALSPINSALAAEPDQGAPVRVLLEENFSSGDGAGWVATKANSATEITFTGGVARIKGGGPENRVMSEADILASDLTLGLDLFINEGNTNSAIKIGFFSDSSGANRHQLTWDGPHETLRFERVVNGVATVLGVPANLALPVNSGGSPHQVTITSTGDRLQASVNGTSLLEVSDTSVAQAHEGHVLFAGQFPNQDFSIGHVRVTTTESERSGQYAVEVQTKTNGTMDTDAATAGGSLSANRSSGDSGDVVTLTPTAKPGFVFQGYESLRLDTGTSTDGLLTITNNRFTLDDKTGSVIIIAKFVTEPEDPNVVFTDHFNDPLNKHGKYTFNAPSAMSIIDGALHIRPETGPAYAIVDASSWRNPSNYRIQLDARKASGTAGTAQIAFRGEAFSDRYVLALNGSKALLRRLDSQGANIELASTNFTFDQNSRRIIIDVTDDTVSVSANGTPLLSYVNTDDPDRDADNWSGLSPGLSLINMTPTSSVAFDNVQVARVPVPVRASVDVTLDDIPDPSQVSGAVVLSSYLVGAGERITWEAVAKGGYTFDRLTQDGIEVPAAGLVISEEQSEPVILVANFTRSSTTPTTYYIDPSVGDDSNTGTSVSRPWASLAKLDRTFNPGDKILLKRGSSFSGSASALAFRGSGSAEKPIVVGAYGEGRQPQLNGAGQVENVVSVNNQEHITISDLEITNTAPEFGATFALNSNTNRAKNLRAVNVSARDFGIVHGIQITNLYIHDINGNLAAKWNGGIFFDVAGEVAGGELHGVPTKYDGVRIESNVLERVDRSGIKLVSSAWANQSTANNPGTPLHWFPSTDVIVRDNQLRYMGGDAITVRDTDGALIEYNLARHSRYQNTGYNAGIWPFQATNTVIQYNEVSHTHGVQDGQGLDTDHVSSYTVMQYNYSHNNEGGFMLLMNGFPHTAPTVRYNISQNDADKTFEFARGTAAGTMIYNNTISSSTKLQGPRGGVLDLANSAAGTGNREVFIFNNVFDYPAGQPFYVGEAETMKTRAMLFNNAYTGGIQPPAEETQALTGALGLPDLGSVPDDAGATQPRAGKYVDDHFSGYMPDADSPLRTAGVSVQDIVDLYDGTVVDRRNLSPTEIHALALDGNSIDFVAGAFLPAIEEVRYDLDFLGQPLAAAPKDVPSVRSWDTAPELSIGAIQYVDPMSEGPGESGGGTDEDDEEFNPGQPGAGTSSGTNSGQSGTHGPDSGQTNEDVEAGTYENGNLAATGVGWRSGLIAGAGALLVTGLLLLRRRAHK